jgi:outer membrane protein assembly factor BamB
VRTPLCIGFAAMLAAHAHAQPWMQFARGPQRLSTTSTSPASLGSPRWSVTHAGGQPITFVGPAGAVTDGMRIYAHGRIGAQAYCFALAQETGAVVWAAPLPPPHLDSWSTPAVDLARGAVLATGGRFVTALDLHTGQQRWQTELARNIVNASPLIVDPLGRAFITDFDGFGSSASLYCINLLPLAPGNPWEPGQIIWSAPIGGSSGNTPAYDGGRIFVASTGSGSAGQVFAFDAAAPASPAPLWIFTNPHTTGFFGGVSVHAGAVYAASYATFGGLFSANMVKLDAATGSLLWSTPSNRTDTTPIPLPDGRIALSTGIHGFGTAPSLQLFQDNTTSASLLWDSALSTWDDLNSNGVLDPGEYLPLGWWTLQPVFWTSPEGPRLWIGTVGPGAPSFGAATDLYLLDLSKTPADPGFILDHDEGCGSTPAIEGQMLFTVGAGILRAYGTPACYANCDQSTTPPILNIADFSCFLTRFAAGDPRANCDLSTTPPVLNIADFSCFLARFAGGCP